MTMSFSDGAAASVDRLSFEVGWIDVLLEPGGRKTPVPGSGKRGGGCLGADTDHPAEVGGRGTGVGKGMPGATAAGTNIGWTALVGGSCGHKGGAGNTPAAGTGIWCLGPIEWRKWFGDLLGGGTQWDGDAAVAEG